MGKTLTKCPCCGGESFKQQKILWPKLIKEWGLTKDEVAYINRQQGFTCESCGSNLRSMMLAEALLRFEGFDGALCDLVGRKVNAKHLLEINEAGHLHPLLKKLPHYTFAEYPDVDIMQLPYKDNSFDVVVHSDTLEHVSDPVMALKEVWRVLKPGGYVCYTIPVVVGRLTRRRDNKVASYHGTPGQDDYLVETEYGGDMWVQLIEAGFDECRLISVDFPASIAIVGVKAGATNKPDSRWRGLIEKMKVVKA